MYLEETCVVYLIERPSVGRELRLKLESCGNLCRLLNCEVFGGPRVKTRRCILKKLVLFT